MATQMKLGSEFEFEKFRLRRFVDRLIDIGEVDIREEPVSLTDLSAIIENTPKAVLFKQAGPDRLEMIAKAMARPAVSRTTMAEIHLPSRVSCGSVAAGLRWPA